MKTMLTAAILGITGLAGAAGAEAQDLRHYRNDRHDRRVESRHRPRHDYRRDYRPARPIAPRMERYWVAPRYETVYVGVDHCGRPQYRTVCVSAGYWAYRRC
jgi:hypothetical protein